MWVCFFKVKVCAHLVKYRGYMRAWFSKLVHETVSETAGACCRKKYLNTEKQRKGTESGVFYQQYFSPVTHGPGLHSRVPSSPFKGTARLLRSSLVLSSHRRACCHQPSILCWPPSICVPSQQKAFQHTHKGSGWMASTPPQQSLCLVRGCWTPHAVNLTRSQQSVFTKVWLFFFFFTITNNNETL